MVLSIVLFVRRQVGDPEVRGEVDHPLAGADQGPGVFRRRPVRQREEKERHVTRRQRRRIRGHKPDPAVDAPDGGDHLGERLSGVGPRGHARELNPGVTQEQLHERFARITRRAYDADLHGKRTIKLDESKLQK